MLIKNNRFFIDFSYPSLALIALIVISNINTGYLLCFISVLIHESGHLLAMKLCGFSSSGIKISLFNIEIIEKNRHCTDFRSDILITASGPLINLATYFISLPLNTAFAYVNLLIGLFNLLPAASLDGGQLLYLFLSKRLSNEKSAKIVDVVTLISIFPLFLVGILVLLNSRYNFSLLFISMYLILSIFIRKDKYL